MVTWLRETGEIYQGQFGEFTVTAEDRLSVVIYRAGLTAAATAFALGTVLTLMPVHVLHFDLILSGLFALFCTGLGVSLWTIHIYLKPLHRVLQVCWAVGSFTALALLIRSAQSLPSAVYPPFSGALIGVGFVFVAFTGLLVKEAFCFNRWQAKILALVVPTVLLGHWLGLLPVDVEKTLVILWAIIFGLFVVDKDLQAIPPDLGDKSVFEYLKNPRPLQP